MIFALITFPASEMATWILLAIILAGLCALCLGGEVLTRGAVALAVNLKIQPLFVGLTVVSIATSMPELSTSLSAIGNHPDMAMGNIIGSNLANTGLILGVAALIAPFRVQLRVISQELPILLSVTVLFGLLILGDGIGRVEGLFLLCILLGYLIFILRQSRLKNGKGKESIVDETILKGDLSTLLALIFIVAGTLLLIVGADNLVEASSELAMRIGVNDMFIGLTVVAVGTSLPELAACLAAVRAGQGDLCAGNVLGSNLFNLLLIGGATASFSGMPTDVYQLRIEYPSLLLLSCLLFCFFRSGHALNRREGICLLILYFASLSLSAINQCAINN